MSAPCPISCSPATWKISSPNANKQSLSFRPPSKTLHRRFSCVATSQEQKRGKRLRAAAPHPEANHETLTPYTRGVKTARPMAMARQLHWS